MGCGLGLQDPGSAVCIVSSSRAHRPRMRKEGAKAIDMMGSCYWGHGVVTVGLGGRAPGSGTCQRGRDQPWSRVVIRCKGGHVAGGT